MTNTDYLSLDPAFVIQVAALYDASDDEAVIVSDEFRRPILDRGHLSRDELARIVE
jgi:hypothetical protein